MRHDLEAREYKLLLDPAKSAPLVTLAGANRFWTETLQAVVATKLSAPLRAQGAFKPAEVRSVQFFDAPTCVLTRHDYSLRARASRNPETGEAEREISIKLRSPDLFVVASTPLSGRRKKKKPTFEEDIAPLEVQAGGHVALAKPPSIRSRFSLSARQSLAPDEELRTRADVARLFPTLGRLLAEGADTVADDVLVSGPEVQEVVFKGAKVDLGRGLVANFALTIWCFLPVRTVRVAEISFKCKFEGRFMPHRPAVRAFALFVGMQEHLADHVDLKEASKTKLALPEACSKL